MFNLLGDMILALRSKIRGLVIRGREPILEFAWFKFSSGSPVWLISFSETGLRVCAQCRPVEDEMATCICQQPQQRTLHLAIIVWMDLGDGSFPIDCRQVVELQLTTASYHWRPGWDL